MKYPINTGTSVIPSPAATAIDQVLVNASGENILPPALKREDRNKRQGDDQQVAEERYHFHRCTFGQMPVIPDDVLPGLPLPPFQQLRMFSIITIAASTIAPMAMVIPPSDIMFALIVLIMHHHKCAQNAQRQGDNRHQRRTKWNRNSAQTTTTTANSSSRSRVSAF